MVVLLLSSLLSSPLFSVPQESKDLLLLHLLLGFLKIQFTIPTFFFFSQYFFPCLKVRSSHVIVYGLKK